MSGAAGEAAAFEGETKTSPVRKNRLHERPNGSKITLAFCGEVPKWPKGTDCKSAGRRLHGSNPALHHQIDSENVQMGWSSQASRQTHNPRSQVNPAPQPTPFMVLA